MIIHTDTSDQSVSQSVLMMGHPVNPVDLDLAEVASFYCEDLLEELRLRIHVIVIVVAAQDLVTLQYVLDVHG